MNPAGWCRRVAAFLLDLFILALVLMLLAMIFMDSLVRLVPGSSLFSWVWLLVAMGAIGMFLCRDAFDGVSIGRFASGIVVRDVFIPHRSPGTFRLMLRNLFALLWPLDLLWVVMRRDGRRLGDRFARTVVLYSSQRAMRLVRLGLAAVVVLSVFSFFLVTPETFLMRSEPYAVASAFLKSDAQIDEIAGGVKQLGWFASGQLSVVDGIGQAKVRMLVDGDRRDVMVDVRLCRDVKGNWEVVGFNHHYDW
ncbi:RDD family protein [Breznakibacter xylanolyticus]|uniref:RDD family protein n=1 Tax=Breznakibacter xylanolyticus TaxID=990 RepID=A0A2W7NJ44_9BACT|nr:RDD family protein [Breznakibacter xylanolyticus]PZX19453.1 RDD family protein [Breznakibacter xylanolyticus]